MSKKSSIETIRQAFADFDLGPIAGRIADAKADLSRIENAIAAAQARQSEIVATKAKLTAEGAVGVALAEALLADPSTSTAEIAVESVATLEAEFEGLRSAVQELKRRHHEVEAQLDAVTMIAWESVIAAGQPLGEIVRARVDKAFNALISAYADAATVSRALRIGYEVTEDCRRVLQVAVSQGGRLVKPNTLAPASTEIASTLALIAERCSGLAMDVESPVHIG
ncbi:hypothetical protein ACFOON_05855 [Novosphingobium piscinae]|uniref:Uncharacterized protein n=1 Tax=Novosphingobium piscinae TaxID=1507448 RepID=A0A7X1FZ55_9SPHN|nr:hypothetical protein [Novosphingobium piscinae]MBC2669653.1 hypothetical protein [Novosphingobium piscinae]